MESPNNRDRWWYSTLRSKVCIFTIMSSTSKWQPGWPVLQIAIEMVSRMWLCLRTDRILFNIYSQKHSQCRGRGHGFNPWSGN